MKSTLEPFKTEIITNYIKGDSSNKIAKEYNVSHTTVINFLKHNKIKMKQHRVLKIDMIRSKYGNQLHATKDKTKLAELKTKIAEELGTSIVFVRRLTKRIIENDK